LGGRLIPPKVIPTITLSRNTFLPKDEIQINLNLSNTTPFDLKETPISISIQDPNNNTIFSTNTTISLASNTSASLSYFQILKEESIPGVYKVTAKTISDSVVTYFTVPEKKVSISYEPFTIKQGTNTIVFNIKNTGIIPTDDLGFRIWDLGFGTFTYPALEPNGVISIFYNFYLPEITFGTYTLSYELDYARNQPPLSGTEIVRVINTINPQIELVKVSALLQSYPNPAENSCYIPFKLANDSNIELTIYNILGQKVRTIKVGQRKKGLYTQKDRAIFWNLKNDSGQQVSKGLYFYQLKAGEFYAIKAMVVK